MDIHERIAVEQMWHLRDMLNVCLRYIHLLPNTAYENYRHEIEAVEAKNPHERHMAELRARREERAA